VIVNTLNEYSVDTLRSIIRTDPRYKAPPDMTWIIAKSEIHKMKKADLIRFIIKNDVNSSISNKLRTEILNYFQRKKELDELDNKDNIEKNEEPVIEEPLSPSNDLNDSKVDIEHNNKDDKKEGEIYGVLGEGRSNDDRGMSDVEINKLMKKIPDYIDTIAHDQMKSKILPYVKSQSRGACIINTDPASKAGQHWQALYWNAHPEGSNSIEFYDSFGDECDKRLLKDIKQLADKLDVKTSIDINI